MVELAFLEQGRIAQQQILEDGSLFPMVLLPPSPHEHPSIGFLLNAIQHNRVWIDNQLKRVGALLFRGFPVRSASDFNSVVEAFGWEEHPYLGLASRTRIEGRVYTANEAPLDQPIKFHHEMAMVSWFYPLHTALYVFSGSLNLFLELFFVIRFDDTAVFFLSVL